MATNESGGEIAALNPEVPGPDLVVPVLAPARPRVWTTFVALLAALGAILASQVIFGIVLVIWYTASGRNVQNLASELSDLITKPLVFISLALLSQVLFGLAAIIPARLSPEPTLDRLGLVTPRLPTWAFPVIMLSTIAPAALGLAAAQALARVIAPDPSVRKLYEQMTMDVAIPFILCIALAPGFMEELMFRGYIQRRLLQRWSPLIAIGVSSVIFAIMHITPHAIAFAFPVGLWLGVIAWRTGSVWPGILCHAFINGFWNIWQIGVRLAEVPARPQIVAAAIVVAVGIVCFLTTLGLFIRTSEDTVDAVLER
jgi:membrane protease YdiL (CAAX protease family)